MLVATLIRSRRLDIRKVPFSRFYEPIRVEIYKNAKEKKTNKQKQQQQQEGGQNPAHLTEQAWSMTEFLYGQNLRSLLAGQQREIPSGEDKSAILPARRANQNASFNSSYPLAKLAI